MVLHVFQEFSDFILYPYLKYSSQKSTKYISTIFCYFLNVRKIEEFLL